MTSSPTQPINIGYVPLLDAAPLIIAQEAGFFDQQNLTVNLVRENSWAGIRDKLTLGMLDGAHMLAPMLLNSQMQRATGRGVSLKTALALGYNGNAVTVSNQLAKDIGIATASLDEALAALREKVIKSPAPLRVGTVFAQSMHSFLLRLLMNRAGIPMSKIDLQVIPPVRMVEAMTRGDVDLFCVGEPWNTAAQRAQAGQILCYGSELWSHAPEKVLAIREHFDGQHPEAHRQLLKALLQAGQWLEEPDHKAQAALWIAREDYLNCSSDLLIHAMLNQWCGQASPAMHRKIFFSEYAMAPWPAHAEWILRALRSAHPQMQGDVDIHQVYDWSLFVSALQDLDLPVPESAIPPGMINEQP